MIKVIVFLIISLLPFSDSYALEIDGEIYTRHYFQSGFFNDPMEGQLLGLHLESSFKNGKIIPFIDWEWSFIDYDSNLHVTPRRGNQGAGIRSEWGNLILKFKGSSIHRFDGYNPPWEYNYVEAKYKF